MMTSISWTRIGVLALLIFVTISFGILIGLRIPDMNNLVLEGAVNFTAVLAGALVAFWLQARREDAKLRAAQLAAVNLMILGLAGRLGVLSGLKKDLIDPVRDHEFKQFLLRPAHASWPSYVVDYSALSSLLDKDLAPYVMRIFASDNTYNLARESVAYHGDLHNQYQTAMDASAFALLESVNDKEIRKIIGEKLWTSIELSSIGMIDLVDDAHAKILSILREFPHAFKMSFKESTILCLQRSDIDQIQIGHL
ncbi:MAG: hypothetical protein M3Y70_10505 [Pseudomonadota bacterium]|nr:hypothetical protein [Pseudomonadota bacterium]